MSQPQPPADDGLLASSRRKLSFWATVQAVAWSFFGVRRGADYQKDVANLNPVHVIVAAVLGGLIFIGALILLVRWAIHSIAG